MRIVSPKLQQLAALCILFGIASNAAASELVLTPPPGYVENSPKGNFECARGTQPMITRVDFRSFALRNQVWQQEASVDFSGWTTGRTLSKPSVGFVKGRLKAQVYVLVAGDGKLLDKVVTCSSAPKYNDELLKLMDRFTFEPSSYKGTGLVTIMPVDFDI